MQNLALYISGVGIFHKLLQEIEIETTITTPVINQTIQTLVILKQNTLKWIFFFFNSRGMKHSKERQKTLQKLKWCPGVLRFTVLENNLKRHSGEES